MKQITFALLASVALSSAAWAETPAEREMHSFSYVQQVGNHAAVEQPYHQDMYHDEPMTHTEGHPHPHHHHHKGHHADAHHDAAAHHHDGHHHHHHKDGKKPAVAPKQ